MSYNCIFLLGPTATGKTAIAARLAALLKGEIISADSRQVYKNLDIGSGKDLSDYVLSVKELNEIKSCFPALGGTCAFAESETFSVPYHLIDVTELPAEYNVYDYQSDFYKVFSELKNRGALPVVAGGTGMYADSVIRSYKLADTSGSDELRLELEKLSYDELKNILIEEKQNLHNTTDFACKERLIRAIIIERYQKKEERGSEKSEMPHRPEIKPLVMETSFDRTLLREKIAARLKARLDCGMIEEVRLLHESGIAWERLDALGLEYRFVSRYLRGEIESKENLFEQLNFAIGRFAKRQETWFRGMEKKGVKINHLPRVADMRERLFAAIDLVLACDFE